MQHQPDVVPEQRTDAHSEEYRHYEHEENVIPAGKLTIILISRTKYLLGGSIINQMISILWRLTTLHYNLLILLPPLRIILTSFLHLKQPDLQEVSCRGSGYENAVGQGVAEEQQKELKYGMIKVSLGGESRR